MTPDTTRPSPSSSQSPAVFAPELQFFVFALFFIFGGITSLNDVIIPKLKGLFSLGYMEAMLVQSAFFAAYFLFSLPASALVQRVGYLWSAAIGLFTMMAGCLLFVPASAIGQFPVFLFALFVLAAGITTVQVVANPLISLLGPPATAPSRLTFAQAFNALGTAIFPYFGSILILGSLSRQDPELLTGAALDQYRSLETHVIVQTYLGLAAALFVVAIVVLLGRRKLQDRHTRESVLKAFDLLKRPRFAFGTLCIFVYVGAEVAIGSLLVSFLEQADVMNLGAEAAGKHVPLYWGGALLGRFVGASVLRYVTPGKVLATVACGAIALLLLAANSHGDVSGWAVLAIGLMNSIMFPTIFSLASQGLGTRAAEGSGVICMGIVGGALIPPLVGHLADGHGLRFAFILPGLCYALIAAFGWYTARTAAPAESTSGA